MDTTEENRIKVSKYRARKAMREAGYAEQEIIDAVASVDWRMITPKQFLASLTAYPAHIDVRHVPGWNDTQHVPAARSPEDTEPDIDYADLAETLVAIGKRFPVATLGVCGGLVSLAGYLHFSR